MGALVAVGMLTPAVPAVSAGAAPAATPPTYTWPEMHHDRQVSGLSSDPSLKVGNAGDLGIRWMTNTGALALGSPVVAWNAPLSKTLVFVPNDAGYLVAYDQATGLPVWSDQFGAPIRSTPLVDGPYLWIGVTPGERLYKLDAATGATVCSAPITTVTGETIDAEPTIATPPGGHKTVYIGANDTGDHNGPVTAVNGSDCTVDWRATPEPQAGSGGVWDAISYGVDATGEALVLFGTADPDGAVYAIDAVTGKLVWRHAVANPRGLTDVGAGVTISLPGVNGFAHGVAYVESKAGIMYALDLTTGALMWQYDFGANSGADPPGSLSTPALDGTSLIFGDGGGIYNLDALTGSLRWRYANRAETDSAPAVVGPPGFRIVAFGSLDGGVYVLSAPTGNLLYHYQTDSFITASVAETDGNLIVSSGDGYLYDFTVGGGNNPPPTTVVSSPADASTVANHGSVTINGSATGSAPVRAVTVAIQQGGSGGRWWDAATQSWTVAPYPNPAMLSAPGRTHTNWTVHVPVPPEGGELQVLASAVNRSGVADRSAAESAPTAARSTFTVRPSSSAPQLFSASFAAPLAPFSVSGQGFAPGEKVDLKIAGTVLAEITASSSGAVPRTTVSIPTTVPFGPQSLVAVGERSGRSTTDSLYVTSSWAQDRQSPLHPGADPNDTVFTTHLSVNKSNFLTESWSFTAGGAVNGSVAVNQGMAYAADSSGDVYAIRIQTGKQIWRFHDDGPAIDDTPAVAGGRVIVGTSAGTIIALDRATGQRAWTTALGGGSVMSSPAVDGSTVYVTSENAHLYALDLSTGKQIWSVPLAGPSDSTPAVDGSAGLAVVGDNSGHITAVSLARGAKVWTTDTGGPVVTAPLISAGIVYVGSGDHNVYALNERTGAVIWKFATQGNVTAAGALFGDRSVVFGSADGHDYYLDRSNGSVVFNVTLSSGIGGVSASAKFSASVTADGALVGSKPAADDPIAWKAKPGGALASAPTVVNGEVFVTGRSGMIICYTVPTHPPV